MTTNFEILDQAEKLELLAAELYGALAGRFGDDPAAAALFRRLKGEEEQHAARIRLLASQARRDGKLLGRLTVDTAEMDDVVRELGAVLAEVRAGRWEADLPATKRRLLELEERCARAHAHLLYQGVHESLREFFAQLARQDEAHEALLKG